MRPAGQSNGSAVFGVFQTIGGLAAVVLGLLYLTGIGIKTRELQHAGVSVRDGLPLFSLEQILRTSFTVVWPSLTVLLIAGLTLAVSHRYEHWLARLSTEFATEEIARRPEDQALLKAAKHVERRANWRLIRQELQQAVDESRSANDEARLKKLLHLRRAHRGWDAIGIVVFMIVFPLTFLYLPLWIAVSCVVLYYAFVLVAQTRFQGPAERELAGLYAIFVSGLLAFAILYPHPLARATIQPGDVSGRFIVLSDSTWYLAMGDGRIRAVPADEIECAELRPRSREKTALLELLDFLADDSPARAAPASTTLECT